MAAYIQVGFSAGVLNQANNKLRQVLMLEIKLSMKFLTAEISSAGATSVSVSPYLGKKKKNVGSAYCGTGVRTLN